MNSMSSSSSRLLAGSLIIAAAVGGAEAFGFRSITLSLAAIALSAVMLLRHAAVEHDSLAMAGLLAVTVLVLYLARPMYVLAHHTYGAAAKADNRYVTASVHDSISRTLVLCAMAIALLMAGYAIGVGRPKALENAGELSRAFNVSLPQGRLLVVALGAVALAMASLFFLIKSSGGLGAYLVGISNKGEFLYGRQWLMLARLPLKGVFLACCAVTAIRRERSVPWKLLIALGFGVALSEFLSGGRAGLILGGFLPVALLFHYLSRRVRFMRLVLIGCVAAVVFLGMRVVTRDSVLANPEKKSTLSLVLSSLRDYPDATIGGTDAAPFDSFLTMIDRPGVANLPLGGATYGAALTAPVPRALWSGKPDGGGNTWFTSAYYPRFYEGHVETSLSLLGELWANFGEVGLAFGALLFGMVVGRLYRWMRSGDVRALLFYSVIAGCCLTAIRGDAYQTVANLIGALITATVAAAVLTRTPSSADLSSFDPDRVAPESRSRGGSVNRFHASRQVALVGATAAGARAASLCFLVVAGGVLGDGSIATIIYALSTSVAVGTICDPQSQPLLVFTAGSDRVLPSGLWKGARRLQAFTALASALLAVVVALVVARPPAQLAVLCVAICIAGSADQFARFRRTPWQIERLYDRYAGVDVLIAGARTTAAATLVVTHRPVVAAISLMAGSVASVVFSCAARPRIQPGPDCGLVLTFRACLPYSVATTASAIYSQVPAVLVGVVGGVQSAALLGFASRLTQPTEFAAGAISTIGIERLCSTPTGPRRRQLGRRFVMVAAGAGAVCAGAVWLCAGPLASHAGIDDRDLGVVIILQSFTLIPKFVSYQLVAEAVAAGRIRQRALISGICAVLSVLIVLATAQKGAATVAAGILTIELVLVASLFAFGRRNSGTLELAERVEGASEFAADSGLIFSPPRSRALRFN